MSRFQRLACSWRTISGTNLISVSRSQLAAEWPGSISTLLQLRERCREFCSDSHRPLTQLPGEPEQGVEQGPLVEYKALKQSPAFREDARQESTVGLLQNLFEEIQKPVQGIKKRTRPSGLTVVESVHAGQDNPWWEGLTHFLKGRGGSSADHSRLVTRGLYMHGGVGVGKTMLMDMFARSAPQEFKLLRTHYHDFMLDVHQRLRSQQHATQDPLLQVADEITRSTKVLCLDEFFVTDVADAAILSRLFGRLWDNGLVLVATSNRAPDKLYKNGLQRHLFLPFIARLKERCIVHDMASTLDYRKLVRNQRGLQFLGEGSDSKLRERFSEIAKNNIATNVHIPVAMGRNLLVPFDGGKACMFEFSQLCDQPVGAADFIALAKQYHTLALLGVPKFGGSNRPAAYRFVTLVDILYEHRIRFIYSAEGTPFELFAKVLTQEDAHRAWVESRKANDDDLLVDDNLGFSKERTISRLTEMQSMEYLIAHSNTHAPEIIRAAEAPDVHKAVELK